MKTLNKAMNPNIYLKAFFLKIKFLLLPMERNISFLNEH